ncbi:hypothetical protein CONPUDRAFT_159495 [Coniophora puteana RWD-64-598 SS2]|uniref:Uncharacterized protein n=1 Tax=Coniophora puteana (strain RWD-64-598) TaxID=741705 RepID=A0A5M3M7W9_CONPW|nr:uncharacterized protein CONPUDRAFT_159495 [Coniophora puteana RWD-64-598 SS2]EIW75372.1 hypothetical protein CONPUDRAFT_159495 [Coniophora puteana RWD-64-598 SS2]
MPPEMLLNAALNTKVRRTDYVRSLYFFVICHFYGGEPSVRWLVEGVKDPRRSGPVEVGLPRETRSAGDAAGNESSEGIEGAGGSKCTVGADEWSHRKARGGGVESPGTESLGVCQQRTTADGHVCRQMHLESLVLTKSPVMDVGDLSERRFPSLQDVFLYTDQFIISSQPFSLPKVRVFGFSYRDPSFDRPHIFDVADLPSLSTLVITLRSETHLQHLAQFYEQLCGGLSTFEVLLNRTTSWYGNRTLVSSRLPKASAMFKYH